MEPSRFYGVFYPVEGSFLILATIGPTPPGRRWKWTEDTLRIRRKGDLGKGGGGEVAKGDGGVTVMWIAKRLHILCDPFATPLGRGASLLDGFRGCSTFGFVTG